MQNHYQIFTKKNKSPTNAFNFKKRLNFKAQNLEISKSLAKKRLGFFNALNSCHTERSEVSIQKTENKLLKIEFVDFSPFTKAQNDKGLFVILSAAKYP